MRHALLAVLLLLIPTALPASNSASGDCDPTTAAVTGCVRGGGVILIGNESTPGNPGTGPGAGTSGNSGGWSFTPGWSQCVFVLTPNPAVCTPAAAAPPATPGTPTITISDIATFIPTPGRQQMEPDGWTIAGLDTNFYAITGQHLVTGTLLGRPADVRFTPIAYRWAYGDGTSATKNTAGGTWAGQGIPEFEPTPTSHVYEQVGDYTITLSIVFAAEYRFAGGSWRPVVGTITLPANDLHIRAGTAKTVLVEHDCTQNPSGPGC
jgi:hypothetical protein